MRPVISIVGDSLIIQDDEGIIAGRHRNQLAYWGFSFDSTRKCFVAEPSNAHAVIDKASSYLAKNGIELAFSEEVIESRKTLSGLREELALAASHGASFKQGEVDPAQANPFLDYLAAHVPRKLKEHQVKAALHLLAVGNGANFSVPGSGKTTVVLSVFSWLRSQGEVDSLFVAGPPSCFGPWRTEFAAVLGQEPRSVVLAGGDIDDRRALYASGRSDPHDLYLTSFQTLQNDWRKVQPLLAESGRKFFFVVDEAHYIKQLGGIWATAVLQTAPLAERRCVLTGTPFPRTYSDSFNLFDVLWPRQSPLSQDDRVRLEFLTQKERHEEAIDLLSSTIGPLFYRVRKTELRLASQRFQPPVMATMGPLEQRIYDAILDRIQELSMKDYLRDIDLLTKLRRGRMIRLRQTISYGKLLATAVPDYQEEVVDGSQSLAEIIRNYDDLETPGKIHALLDLVGSLRARGEKVVVWSNFIGTLNLIERHLSAAGHGVRLIYGETPTQSATLDDETTRERIIASFVSRTSGVDVLVANPAACAESISLHKTCSHAIYYDLSYNCSQYLQSLDRIHRVGGSENKDAYYHFLQYEHSLDQDLLSNVLAKAERMSAIIDQEYPIYTLDMFDEDDELQAYARLFE